MDYVAAEHAPAVEKYVEETKRRVSLSAKWEIR